MVTSLSIHHRRLFHSKTEDLWNDLLTYCQEHEEYYVNRFDYHYGLELGEALDLTKELPEVLEQVAKSKRYLNEILGEEVEDVIAHRRYGLDLSF